MRRLTLAGLVLVVLGLLGFVFPRICCTRQRTAVDLGPVSVRAPQRRTVTIPDRASGAAVLVGVGLAVAGSRRR